MECQLENIMIHYESFGEGKLIVMLHGWPADSPTCVRFLELTFKQRNGWKPIYPDLLGIGKTPGMDWITCQDDVLNIFSTSSTALRWGKRFHLRVTPLTVLSHRTSCCHNSISL